MAEISKPMMPSLGIHPISFFSEVRAELSKIVWPTRQEIVRMTAIVIGVSLAIGIYVGGLDLLFTKITDILIKK